MNRENTVSILNLSNGSKCQERRRVNLGCNLVVHLLGLILIFRLPCSAGTVEQDPSVLTEVEYFLDGNKVTASPLLENLRRISGISEGEPLSSYSVSRSIKKIYTMGMFSEVEAFRRDVPDGVFLKFQLTSTIFIKEIEFTGANVSESLIRGVMKTRKGGPFIREVAKQDRQRIKAVYEDHGYLQATVRFLPPPTVRPGGEVTVSYEINEGNQLVIRETRFRGNSSISSKRLKQELKNKEGDTYNKQSVARDSSRLLSLYRREGFLSAQVKVVPPRIDPTGFALTFKMVEGKKVTVKGIHDSSLFKRMSLFKQDSYSDAILESNKLQIEQFYRQKGYYNPKVAYRIELDSKQEVVIQFDVNLGLAPRIDRITFHGIRQFDDATLLDKMKTQPRSRWALPGLRWLFSGGVFDSVIFERDLRALELLYRKAGYPNVQVNAEKEIDSKNRLRLKIDIFEGVQQVINRVAIAGNNVLKTEDLRSQIHARPGQAYSKEGIVIDDHFKLLSLYEREGYIYASVTPEYDAFLFSAKSKLARHFEEGRVSAVIRQLFVNANISVSPNSKVKKREHDWLIVDKNANRTYFAEGENQLLNFYESGLLKYKIVEGRRAFFGEFAFSGNRSRGLQGVVPGLKLHVLRREFESLGLHKGAVFSPNKLLEGQQRLSTLGVFRRVAIDTPGRLEGKEVVEVNVHGELRRPGSIGVSGGYSPSEGVRGTLGILHNNLYKRNMRAGGKFSAGTRGNLYELTLIEPWFIGPTIGTLRLFEDNLEEQDDTRARGGTANLARRLDVYSNFAVQYKYQELRQKVRLMNELESFHKAQDEEIETTVSSLGVSFHRDDREPFLNPRRGWLNELAVEYAGGFIGGKTSFFKFTADNRVYWQIHNLILVNALRTGYARGLRSNRERQIISFERFRAGGATTVRGYEERSLGPLDKLSNTRRGDVLFIYNLEVRFPIYKLVGGTLFFDSGNVWNNLSEIDSASLRFAIGGGMRVDTPLGPVRFDYAFPLLDGHSPQVHIELGQAF